MWPWSRIQALTRARDEAAALQASTVGELERVRAEHDEVRKDRDYWRARAEKLIDSTLGRAGLISEPVMTARPETDNPTLRIMSALGRTEIPKR